MTKDACLGPVFVVGVWRSGTSLLYTLLNQHPQIALTYESDLFLLRTLFPAGASKADWLERWEFWNSALTRHQINTSEIPARASSYSAAATLIWKQYAGKQGEGPVLYGDKSPNYFDCMQELAQEFPNARFIVIWRDLADTCSSIVRAGRGSSFFAKRGITHRALIGYRHMKRDCDALARKGVPLHQIHYEELIESPDAVMRGVCSFLGIQFDARTTSLEDADRSAIYEAPQHEGVKSAKIGKKIGVDEPREEVLSPESRRKIARYVSLWKQESKGAWPTYPQAAADAAPAGPFERLCDEMYFRALRAFDRFTAWVYCHAPIGLLLGYRGAKTAPDETPIAKPARERAALSEVSTRN
jgi:hypothetical protein